MLKILNYEIIIMSSKLIIIFWGAIYCWFYKSGKEKQTENKMAEI